MLLRALVRFNSTAERRERVNLRDRLFASSAFPSVFRPRWEWEVFSESSGTDQFVDGG